MPGPDFLFVSSTTFFRNPGLIFNIELAKKPYAEVVAQEFEVKLQIVRRMQTAGIRLLVGTDYPNPFCYPGFSVHDEMSLFVKTGLSSLQALQAATINPAEFFNLREMAGTVEQGKLANLILLDGNPLENIENTRLISAVIFGGKLFDRKALDHMLAVLQSKVKPK